MRVGVKSWSWRTAKIPTSSIDSLKIKTYYSPTPTKFSNSKKRSAPVGYAAEYLTRFESSLFDKSIA